MSFLPLPDQVAAGAAVAVGGAGALGARILLVAQYRVVSESMAPALCAGDRVLGLKHPRQLARRRGAVVALQDQSAAGKRELIKRITAVGGDEVEISNGVLRVNGAVIPPLCGGSDYGPIRVPDGSLFVLGDHRSASRDSRHFGVIEIEKVVARVLFVCWPLERFGRVQPQSTDRR